MYLAAQSLLGVIAIPLIAWSLSEDRDLLSASQAFKTVAAGLILQFAIAALLLNAPGTTAIFEALSQAVVVLQSATEAGLRVVFGYLAGGPPPFDVTNPGNSFIFAFRALPIILIMSVLSRLLYHWGILQRVVGAIAWALRRSFGVGGPLGTATAANIFVGMVEAPLLIRPYLSTMGRGALFAAMTAGMATVAGTVMALYASLLEPSLPGATGHILAASVISAPAALMIARLMVPKGFSDGPKRAEIELSNGSGSTMGAIAEGTTDGLKLLVYVAAMLVVMIALVTLVNSILGLLTPLFGVPITIENIFGWICAPLAWLIGIPWSEIHTAGQLIGVKVILNELLAYLQLADISTDMLSDRSRLILTYALCGFANFGSLGIMIGGFLAMVPERKEEILLLAPKTIVSGLLATLLTGAIIGVLTPN
jgi:CNT family concentrative nucleoside transporter